MCASVVMFLCITMFTQFQALKAKYGEDSSQFATAVSVVRQVIQEVGALTVLQLPSSNSRLYSYRAAINWLRCTVVISLYKLLRCLGNTSEIWEECGGGVVVV